MNGKGNIEMEMEKCFQTLKLDDNATLEEAKRAYRKLVKIHHPDQFHDAPLEKQKAEEELKQINIAYAKVKAFISTNRKLKKKPERTRDFGKNRGPEEKKYEDVSDKTEKYKKYYSKEDFWTKVKKYAVKAGADLIGKALELYYVLREAGTPAWVKGLCVGALGYFISPFDIIPDVVPIIGFTDDLAVLLLTASAVSRYITPEIRKKAREKVKAILGVDQWSEIGN